MLENTKPTLKIERKYMLGGKQCLMVDYEGEREPWPAVDQETAPPSNELLYTWAFYTLQNLWRHDYF